jgi:hypothetical protein
MKFIPQEKGKAAVYLIIIAAALGGAAYMMYGRGGPTPEVSEEQAAVEEHAAEINATIKSPTPAPDLPIENRPPRGAPSKVK